MVDGKYQYDKASGQWEHFENFALNKRNKVMGKKTFDWAEQQFLDMFN